MIFSRMAVEYYANLEDSSDDDGAEASEESDKENAVDLSDLPLIC